MDTPYYTDESEGRAHGSLNRLVESLIDDGHIIFDHEVGEYRRA